MREAQECVLSTGYLKSSLQNIFKPRKHLIVVNLRTEMYVLPVLVGELHPHKVLVMIGKSP
jgi:hypothetical protein